LNDEGLISSSEWPSLEHFSAIICHSHWFQYYEVTAVAITNLKMDGILYIL